MAPSRSVFERLSILLLAAGVIVPSATAGVHDPACPHHMGHGESAAVHAPATPSGSSQGHAHSGGTDLPAEHLPAGQELPAGGHLAVGDHLPASDHSSGGEDCRCGAGLCALTFSFDPPRPTAGAAFDAVEPASLALAGASQSAVHPASAHRRQPPATGPPPAI